MRPVVSSQLNDPPIERRECATPTNREREQMRVRHLLVPHDAREEAEIVFNQRGVVYPKVVTPHVPQFGKKLDRLTGTLRVRDGTPVGGHTNEPGLGRGARGPSSFPDIRKPVQRPRVVYVIRPHKRHKHVHVQEANQRSSSADSTISGVIGGAFSRTVNTGTSMTIRWLVSCSAVCSRASDP